MLYSHNGDGSGSIRCAHCGGEYTHITKRIGNPKPIEHKDTIWSAPAGMLGCESCPGFTEVHLMFCKGNTFLHTVPVLSR